MNMWLLNPVYAQARFSCHICNWCHVWYHTGLSSHIWKDIAIWYGVATMSRRLKVTGLFCRISLLQGSFAKETYNFKEPSNRSHPIVTYVTKSSLRRAHLCLMWLICVTHWPMPDMTHMCDTLTRMRWIRHMCVRHMCVWDLCVCQTCVCVRHVSVSDLCVCQTCVCVSDMCVCQTCVCVRHVCDLIQPLMSACVFGLAYMCDISHMCDLI